jgi:hypothetical protein
MSMILLETAYKILHSTVKIKRRTISVTPFSGNFILERPIRRHYFQIADDPGATRNSITESGRAISVVSVVSQQGPRFTAGGLDLLVPFRA